MTRRRPVRDQVRAFAAARHLNCKTAAEQARDAEKKIAISSRLSAKDRYQKRDPPAVATGDFICSPVACRVRP